MHGKILLTLVTMVTIMFASELVTAKTVPITLVALSEKDAPGGCSCTIISKKNATIVYRDLEIKSPVTLNINGTITKLNFLSTTDKGNKEKVGKTFVNIYGNEQTKLNLSYKIVRVCGPKEEECETTKYSVNLLLENNMTKKGEDYPNKLELKDLDAYCGC